MISPARLGLLIGVAADAPLRDLLGRLAMWSRLVDAVHPEDRAGPPDAQLWFRDAADPVPAIPTAAWVEDAADLASAAARAATVVVSPVLELASAAGARGVFWPCADLPDTVRPVLPAVRRRLRAGRGLPRVLVVRADTASLSTLGGQSIPIELLDTSLAVASAVVAGDVPTLIRALGWAAPVVTDQPTAEALGALDGEHLRVGPAEQAIELAGDETAATRLAWAGRLFVEQRHDRATAARLVAARLGIPRAPWGTAGVLRDRIEELATASDAPLRHRMGALVGLPYAACP